MPCKPLSCVYGKLVIPQRYIMMVMVCLGLINSYHLRVVLNIAINEIVEPVNKTKGAKYDSCPEFTFEKVDVQGGTYPWPSWLRSFMLYAFFIGYIFGHLPGGWLADKIGPRRVYAVCMFMSVSCTFLWPVSIIHGGYIPGLILRGILGLVQGPVFPASSSFLQNWAPASERTMMAGVVYSGSNLGTFTGNMFTGMMIKQLKSWPMAFYIWASVATLWFLFFLFMVFSYPTTHPFITEGEMEHLKGEIVKKVKFAVPWKRIFLSRPVWAILFSQVGHDYIFFTMVTELPKYMKDVLKMDIQSNAMYSSLPFLCMGVSNICFGALADVFLRHKWCKVLTLRKIYTSVGNLSPALCTICASHIGCTRIGAVAFYTLGMTFMSPFYSGTMVNINDISRHYSGIVMAYINGCGAAMGIFGTLVVGELTKNGSVEEWRLVFWIMGAWTLFTTVMFLILAKADRQEWDITEEERAEDKAE